MAVNAGQAEVWEYKFDPSKYPFCDADKAALSHEGVNKPQ